MDRDAAMREFRSLIAQHGVRWTGRTPREAYERLDQINKVLTEADRRAALQGGHHGSI
jgi:hypothetical protein